MKHTDRRESGKVQLVDVITGFVVLVGLIYLAPFIYEFIDMAAGSADSFSALLLELVMPLLFIAFFLSMSVSARRRA